MAGNDLEGDGTSGGPYINLHSQCVDGVHHGVCHEHGLRFGWRVASVLSAPRMTKMLDEITKL
jgi:hypothetical protein